MATWRTVTALTLAGGLAVGGFSVSPSPSAAAFAGSVVAAPQSSEARAIIDNPYADALGYQLREELATPEARQKLRGELTSALSGEELKAALGRLDEIARTSEYVRAHADELARTELELTTLGDPAGEYNRIRQSYAFDNRDLTGIYVKPGTTSIDVFLDGPAKGIELAWRQTNETESASYTTLGYKRHALKPGFNRVDLGIKDATKPYVLYVRNKTHDKARVRFQAVDVAASESSGLAAANQPASAAPVALGRTLATYPVYIHDPKDPQRFGEWLAAASRSSAPMVDLRFGKQDITTDRALALKEIGTPDDAAAHAEMVNKALNDRLDFFSHYEGYDPQASEGPHAPTPMRRVIIGSTSVKKPSTMFAITEYFHLPASPVAKILAGDKDVLWGWASNHEYGHQLDNTVIFVPEQTNNMYSIAGGIKRWTDKLTDTPTRNFSPASAGHPNLAKSQNEIDRYLNSRLAGGDVDPAFWVDAPVFRHTTTLFNATRYFDDVDYSTYPFDASPFTADDAETLATYGSFGAMLRMAREKRGDVEKLVPQTDETGRYNRMIALGTMATGYSLCGYYEELGFTAITDGVKDVCRRYPDPPVHLAYASIGHTLQLAQARALDIDPLFDETVEARVEKVSDTDDGKTLTLGVSSHASSVALYEVYYDGKLIGFTRTDTFVDPHGNDREAGKYSVVAFDYRLNASGKPQVLPTRGMMMDNEDTTAPEEGDGVADKPGTDHDDAGAEPQPPAPTHEPDEGHQPSAGGQETGAPTPQPSTTLAPPAHELAPESTQTPAPQVKPAPLSEREAATAHGEGFLARTGMDSLTLGLIAATLAALGGVALALARRKRN